AARRSDLSVGMVVHEHRFEVRLGARADLIFSEGAERIALVRTLVVIIGGEVEVADARYELIAFDVTSTGRSARDRVEPAEGALGRGRRTAAIEFAVGGDIL